MTDGPTPQRHRALHILSIDHPDRDLAALAPDRVVEAARLAAFRHAVVAAAADVAAGLPDDQVGVFLDPATATAMASQIARHGLWLACQYPQRADPGGVQAALAGIPARAVVKVIANARSDARTRLSDHLDEIIAIADACRAGGRPLLVEALVDSDASLAALVRDLASSRIVPAYWLVEPQSSAAAWEAFADAAGGAPRTIVIARSLECADDLSLARGAGHVAGFVGGRSVFGAPLAALLAGTTDEATATARVADRFRQLAATWLGAQDGEAR